VWYRICSYVEGSILCRLVSLTFSSHLSPCSPYSSEDGCLFIPYSIVQRNRTHDFKTVIVNEAKDIYQYKNIRRKLLKCKKKKTFFLIKKLCVMVICLFLILLFNTTGCIILKESDNNSICQTIS